MSQDLVAQLRMRWIPAGKYLRGSGGVDAEGGTAEEPRHEVVLTRGFWLSDAPVTQAVWAAVVGGKPSHFEGAARPVEQVSWEDCQRFCADLSRLCAGLHPRLPTEAEWEYAARAGATSPPNDELGDIAWHRGNSGGQTHAVRQKPPNAWGLHDMLGNVYEWCQDHWDHGEPYDVDGEPRVDPFRADGSYRVVRGGSWGDNMDVLRGSAWSARGPGDRARLVGFRLAATEGGAEGPRTPRDGAPSGGPEPTEPR